MPRPPHGLINQSVSDFIAHEPFILGVIFEPAATHAQGDQRQVDQRAVAVPVVLVHGKLAARSHAVDDIGFLRDRIGDIPILAEHFLRKYVEENEKPIDGIADETLEALARYGWPGNVRELENVMERAVVLTRNSHILPADLPPAVIGDETELLESAGPQDEIQPLKRALEAPERRIIERVLRRMNGSRQKTAVALDINRTTLFNKMKKYELLEKF